MLRFTKHLMALRRRSAASRVRSAAAAVMENLEQRRLLSSSWVNENIDDNFDTVYGDDADAARAIVERAVADWNAAVTASPSLSLRIVAASLGAGVRGSTGITAMNGNRTPTAATIQLDNDGAGDGWYFDANPLDDAEFSRHLSRYTATTPTSGTGHIAENDFYRTIVHEIGHAYGLVISSTLRIGDYLEETIYSDPNEIGATLWSFDGGTATLTTSGGGHLFEGTAPNGSGLVTHPNDLMNPGRTSPADPSRRQLITATDLSILETAYGYTVKSTTTLDTFYTTFNEDTGQVTVAADDLVNPTISVSVSGSNLSISLSSGIESFTETIPLAEVNSIVIAGTSGNDTITVDSAVTQPCTISGDAGNDTITGGGGGDSIDGGAGADSIHGGGGADVIDGGVGNDALYGDAGDDVFFDGPGSGNDVYDGGSDTDWVSYYYRTEPLTITMDGVANDGASGESDNVDANGSVEIVSGGSGNDTITGSDREDIIGGNGGADVIDGGALNDTLYGDAGDDVFFDRPSSGNDVYSGGAGNDWVSYYYRTEALTITMDGDANDGASGESDNVDADNSVEILTGGTGDDSITGSSRPDTIDGAAGNDTISGGAGNDVFFDGLNSGNDVYSGGADRDWVSYYYRTEALTITMDGNANDGASGESDNVDADNSVEIVSGGSGSDTITGSTRDDTIEGNAGSDVINGGVGNDVLWGSDGNDNLVGGAGADTLHGGLGDDILWCNGYALPPDNAVDYVYGDDGNDSFYAQDGGIDQLFGGAGSNVLATSDAGEILQ